MASRVLVITGPTATGKTALGVELAKALNGEVVSADSMQIYRRMDIGTAKPTLEEMQGVPHHMLDVAEPDENYSAARYVEDASRCVDDILSRKKLPIIVGGTGLYIDSLILGRDFADAPGDSGIRESLSIEYDKVGGDEMLNRLAKVDPRRAAKLHPSDKKRVVRALEIFELTGITATEHDEKSRAVPPRYDSIKIALTFSERENLYNRIDLRVDKMIERGLVDEVRSLLDSGVSTESTAMQAIGYKELVSVLRGKSELSDAIEEIKRSSRRYAKRQLTWLRRSRPDHWLEWNNEPDLEYARLDLTAFLRSYGLEC